MALSLAQTPVNRQDLTSDEVRRSEEIYNSARDFLGSSAAFRRSVLNHTKSALIDIVERDHAGGDRVHGDFGRERLGERPGQHDHARLRGTIMSVLGTGADAAERADVDDSSAAVLLHDTCSLLAAEEGRFEVDRVNEVPIGFGDFEWVEAGEARGVIDEPIEAAELLLDLGKHA